MKRRVTTAGMYVPMIILNPVICKYFQNLIRFEASTTIRFSRYLHQSVICERAKCELKLLHLLIITECHRQLLLQQEILHSMASKQARLTATDVIDMLEDVSDNDHAYDSDEDECADEVICEGSDIEVHDFDTAEVDDLEVNPQTEHDLDEEMYCKINTLLI